MVSTLYMVEMDFPDHTGPGRDEFEAFYSGHVAMLLTIPGFLVAQRFECIHPTQAPFLAVYLLSGPKVMSSDAYRSRAGRMSVAEEYRIRMTNWDRNLMQGNAEEAGFPVETWRQSCLMLIDRLGEDAPLLPDGFTRLFPIGLDQTIAERGLRIGNPLAVECRSGWNVRTFRALHAPRKPRTHI